MIAKTEGRRGLLPGTTLVLAFIVGLAPPGAAGNQRQPATAGVPTPAGQSSAVTFELDAAGRLAAWVDPAGQTIRYQYDSDGRVTRVVRPDDAVELKYDVLGNRVWMQDAAGLTTYAYDAFQRLKRITFARGGVRHVDYEYDPWDQVVRLSILDEHEQREYSIAFEYDLLGRLATVDDSHGLVRYEHRPESGETVRTLPNGVQTLYSYSSLGALSSIQHRNARGELIASYDYRHDLRTGQVEVREHADGRERARRFALGGDGNWREVETAQHSTQVEPAAGLALLRDGDGVIVARRAGDSTTHYLAAPFGPNRALVGEVDAGGSLARVFVVADGLSLEYSPNPGSTFYLERDLIDRLAALNRRIQTGASADVTRVAPTRVDDHAIQAALSPPCPDVIFVSGVNSYGQTLKQEIAESIGANVVSVTTSYGSLVGGAVGETLESHGLGGLTFAIDSARAFANYALAGPASLLPNPGIASGFGHRDVRNAILSNPDCETLGAHSNGAITVYNCRKTIADLVLAGDSHVSRIVIGGCGLAQSLQRYFDRRGVNITVYDASGGEGFVDMVRAVFTTPNAQLSREVFGSASASAPTHWLAGAGLKVGGLFGGLFDKLRGQETVWTTAHKMDRIDWKDPCPVDFEAQEQRLGGIKLATSPEFSGPLGRILGAVYDPDSQRVVLYGDGDPALPVVTPQHFAVALRCVFGIPRCDPQFSLDPAIPTQPDGPWQRAVYIPAEVLKGTDFGRVMYEADWLLKQYCFGVTLEPGRWLPRNWTKVTDCDGVEVWTSGKARAFHRRMRQVDLPGFRDLAELTFAEDEAAQGEPLRARQWILPDKVTLKRVDGAIEFDTVKMRVEAKKQEIGPDGQLRDAESDEPLAKCFAGIMTDLYDELADQEPAFAEVRELARAMAIAKWLKEEGIPVDREWVDEFAAPAIDVVDRVSRLSVTHERKTEEPFSDGLRRGVRITTHQVTLSGGVDLTVRPRYVADDGTTARRRQLILAGLASATAPNFVVRDGADMLHAAVLPVTSAGRRMTSGGRKTVRRRGMTYTLDGDGLVNAADDGSGNLVEYHWDDGRRLVGITWTSPTGWRARASRTGDGITLELQTPTHDAFTCEYGPSRRLRRVLVNGTEYAHADYQRNGRDVHVVYQGGRYAEQVSCDETGRLSAYSRTVADDTSGGRPRRATFDRDAHGRLISAQADDAGRTTCEYNADRLGTTRTPRGEWRRQYDDAGRLASVHGPEQTELMLDYLGAQLARAVFGLLGDTMEIHYENGRVTRIVDFGGKTTRYGYDDRGNLTSAVHAQGPPTQYRYDALDRPVWAEIAGRYEIAYEYEPIPGAPGGRDEYLRRLRLAVLEAPQRRLVEPPAPVDVTIVEFTGADRDFNVALNNAPSQAWPQLLRRLGELGGRADEDAVVVRDILALWEAQIGPPGDQPVLLVHEPAKVEEVGRLRAILSQAYPSAVFITTTSANRARENLTRLEPIRDGPDSNVEACLVESTLRPGLYGALTAADRGSGNWVRLSQARSRIVDVGYKSNLALVVADRNQALLDELSAAGESGRLRGKAVLFWACGDPALQAEAAKLVQRYGATMVWQARHTIDASIVPALTEALNAVMADYPETLPTNLMEKVINAAIDQELKRAERPGKTVDEALLRAVEALRDCDLISRRSTPGNRDRVAQADHDPVPGRTVAPVGA